MDAQTSAETEQTTRRVTSHATGTVFVDIKDNGEVYVAAMYYTKRNRTTLRLPMGKGKKSGEKITDTQIREATQEAADDPANFTYEFLLPRFVYYEAVPDDRNPNAELHLKAFMVAKITKGDLRKDRAIDREYGPDGNELTEEEEILGPLKWYEARDILNQMAERGNGLKIHLTAVLAALVALAKKYPKVEACYNAVVNREDVLARVEPPSVYRAEVMEYVRSLQG